jgi:hypothetical protein
MNSLRRDGENKKTVETKAAATGAKFALIAGLFKLCRFIFSVKFLFLNFDAKVCIIFYLSKDYLI